MASTNQDKIDFDNIPKHVAIIMDGNGRWAKERGLPRLSGHDAGMKAMKEIVKRASVLGVKHLTVYAFSTENWKRSEEEIGGIFNLLIIYVDQELKELNDNNVKVNIIGDRNALSPKVNKSIDKALNRTKNNDGLQFNIALNYGSRAEIISSVKQIAKEMKKQNIDPDHIDEEMISNHLLTAGMPDPDVIIRTSGEKRLSNFLLWQAAYSEFIFTETLWPEYSPDEFDKSIIEYQGRKRRFGGR